MINERPLRVQLFFHDGLEIVEVIAIVRPFDLPLDALPTGTLHGAPELLAFIRGIPLDSIVKTHQLRDDPIPSFQHVFQVCSADQIVSAIERRLRATLEAYDRIFADEPFSDSDYTDLAPLEHVILGSSEVATPDGARRIREWFGRRVRQTSASEHTEHGEQS